jgi:nucleotide-binding universal stress UspA family protein
MSETLRCIVACTDSSGRYAAVREVATQQALESGARVIFYDVSQDSEMADPRPNFWAGEGEEEVYDRPLDPIAIEKLGFHELALQVQQARVAGVDAYGWLPNEPGGKGLAAYAQRENADLVLMPAGEEETSSYVEEWRQASQQEGALRPAKVRLVDAEANLVPLS